MKKEKKCKCSWPQINADKTPPQDLIKTSYTCIHSDKYDYACGKCIKKLLAKKDKEIVQAEVRSREQGYKIGLFDGRKEERKRMLEEIEKIPHGIYTPTDFIKILKP